jgi:hypothetical protein
VDSLETAVALIVHVLTATTALVVALAGLVKAGAVLLRGIERWQEMRARKALNRVKAMANVSDVKQPQEPPLKIPQGGSGGSLA